MTEQHETYRVTTFDNGLINQLNQIFNLVASRMDKIEGLRGDPTFYKSGFQYPGQTITGFLKAATESADFGAIAGSDLGLTTLELGDTYIKITDSNGVVIHQLGEE